jgi:hypothetical protein
MMQIQCILRTTGCAVKCRGHYRPCLPLLPSLSNSSVIPQPSSCRLPLAKDILYLLLCSPARGGTRCLEESPPTIQKGYGMTAHFARYPGCWHHGGSPVWHPECRQSPRHYPQSLTLVGEKRVAMACCCGTVFQALFDLRGCYPPKAIRGRVRILPIPSRRRGICPRGN